MLSVVITICTAVLLIAGIAYAVFQYFPYIANLFNSVTDLLSVLSASLPDWLLPFATVGLAVAVVGLLVKLF